MSIPESVRRQAEKSEELQKQLAQSLETPAETVETQETVVEPEVTQPVAETVEPEPITPEVTDWEHKFKVLQGKYNAELPRFADEVKALKRTIEQSQQEIKKLKVNLSETKDSKLNVESYGEYGEEFKKMAESVNTLQEDNKKLREYIASLTDTQESIRKNQEQIDAETTQNKQRLFYTELSSLVPDWEATNANKTFLEWLGEVDPVSGYYRQQLLDHAHGNNDAVRVANIFKAFKESRPAVPKKTPPIEPRKDKSDVTSPPNDKPVFSRRDIARFYRDVSQGRIPEERARKIEQEIFLANKEGRVVD